MTSRIQQGQARSISDNGNPVTINEGLLIRRYLTRESSDQSVLVGPGDDAAVLACAPCSEADEGTRLVVTTDTLMEGCHFAGGTSAEDIGYKALAVNLSDIAAMGASPRWATLCLSLPYSNPVEIERWMEEFSTGFFSLATRWHVTLIGGDLVRGKCVVTVQVIGTAMETGILLRSGAVAGDGIYVTGDIGDAGLAWRAADRYMALSPDLKKHCTKKLHRPSPRIEEGKVLSHLASAATDISDGILSDLSNLLDASDVSAQMELERIPLGRGCRSLTRDPGYWLSILTGGDDYELLFTATDGNFALIKRQCREKGLAKITRIGRIIKKCTCRSHFECTLGGKVWSVPDKPGFDHFDP